MYNIGAIGYGGMAVYHHKKILKPDNVRFTAAYDVNPEKLEAAEKNGLKIYKTLEGLLADREIDIILVATPNDSHKELSIHAMRAGKHVICEKPVALNTEQLEEMIAESVANKVVFSVHQNRRMDKDFKIIQKIYNDNTLGKVFRIESRVQGSRGIADTWRRQKAHGGGMLYDWGVHLIDQLLHMIYSRVVSVFAEFQYISQNEVDDNFRLTLTFKNGISALVEIGTCNFIMHPIWYMCGEKGTAQIDYWNLEGRISQLIENDIKWENEIPSTLAGPSITLAPRAGDTVKELPLPGAEVDEGIFYRNYIAAVEGREDLFVMPNEIKRVMRIIDTAFMSESVKQVIQCEI